MSSYNICTLRISWFLTVIPHLVYKNMNFGPQTRASWNHLRRRGFEVRDVQLIISFLKICRYIDTIYFVLQSVILVEMNAIAPLKSSRISALLLSRWMKHRNSLQVNWFFLFCYILKLLFTPKSRQPIVAHWDSVRYQRVFLSLIPIWNTCWVC